MVFGRRGCRQYDDCARKNRRTSPNDDGFVVGDSGIQLGVAAAKRGRYETYDKYFKACFTIAGTKMKKSCVQTMHDTGTTRHHFSNAGNAAVTTYATCLNRSDAKLHYQ